MEKQKIKGMVFAALFAAMTGAVAWFKIPLPFTPIPITLQTLMVLLSGAMLGPYYGALSMFVYLALGTIGLPVFAGGSSGFGALLGPSGGYLFSYPVASFLVGLMTRKKLQHFFNYISFGIILLLVGTVFLDASFKVGIMKLGENYMVDILTGQQRIILVIVSVAVFIGLILLMFYLKKSKSLSLNTILAMFAGTLIIYVMGAVQGKLVTGLPWSSIFVGWVLPFILGDILKLLLAAYIAKSFDMKKYL